MSIEEPNAEKEELNYLQGLRQSHIKRLRELENQAALMGISTPPEIKIEIKEIEQKVANADQKIKELKQKINENDTQSLAQKAGIISEIAEQQNIQQDNASKPITALQKSLEQLYADALQADWEETPESLDRAIGLYEQINSKSPGYKKVALYLDIAAQKREAAQIYEEAIARRKDGDWLGAEKALQRVEKIFPDLLDRQQIQPWVDRQRMLSKLLDESESALQANNIQQARRICETGLREAPEDDHFKKLRDRIDQVEAAQISKIQRRKNKLEYVERFRNLGLVGAALDELEAPELGALFANNPETTIITWVEQWATEPDATKVSFDYRRRAAQLLGKGTDPRPGVCSLPPEWCESFSAKDYPFGALTEKGDRRQVSLDMFWIARYPVTVAQFMAFLSDDARGYDFEEYWTVEGRNWKEDRGSSAAAFRERLDGTMLNHPITGVSWYEATAFCAWLTWKAHEENWLEIHEVISLPTEAEWEIAAEWDGETLRSWPQLPKPKPPSPRKEKPTPDELRQNVAATQFGSAVPVGLFPNGASPCGALDMAGNVWEWCASTFADAAIPALDFLFRQPAPQQEQEQPSDETSQGVPILSKLDQATDNFTNQTVESTPPDVERERSNDEIDDDTTKNNDLDEITVKPAIRGGSYLLESGLEGIGFGWDARSEQLPHNYEDIGFRLCKRHIPAMTD